MVKNIPQELKPVAKLETATDPRPSNFNPEEFDSSSQEMHEPIPSLDACNPKKPSLAKAKKSQIKFENTAVGCLIQYLRKNSPSSLEDIVRHVKSVESSLITTGGTKFRLNAFKIADHAISWNPKLFLLDRHFNYCLNETKAAEVEENFKNRDARKAQQERESKERSNKRLQLQIEKRKSWEKIRKIIMNDLSGDMDDPSYLTKVFLILTSGNKELASKVTKEIRLAYFNMIKNKNSNSS
ncbi:unnamed protein product [Blepharisma stoltei]|uniref:Uncharacterized protein n=1 Tax=Blepharisma stoltei TaxID=1481888 RepID=A0AAU9JYB4_9CILI|nr:unnamed protein product [Blepharisma stoltei]